MMLLRTLTAPSFFAALALAAASVRTATDSAVPAPTVQEPEAESWRTWVEELAPPYIRLNGRGPNRDAVQPLLEFLLIEGGPPSNAEDLERARMMVFERLLPNLEADHCAWIRPLPTLGTNPTLRCVCRQVCVWVFFDRVVRPCHLCLTRVIQLSLAVLFLTFFSIYISVFFYHCK